jgi:hypothetical protein
MACADQGVAGGPCPAIACVDCSGLGETECSATPGCEPLECPTCNGSSFVGCAPEGSGPPPCAAPICSDCQTLDEAACSGADGAALGCTAAYCPGCLAGDDFYAGCYGPDEGAPPCPAVDCAPVCRTSNDCGNGDSCLAPGQSPGCGNCQVIPDPCTSDADCASAGTSMVCEPAACACGGESQCVPSCFVGNDACKVGESCRKDGHCGPTPCSATSECPPEFDCSPTPGSCQRRACQSDDDCQDPGASTCVNGSCYDQPGMCSPPVP